VVKAGQDCLAADQFGGGGAGSAEGELDRAEGPAEAVGEGGRVEGDVVGVLADDRAGLVSRSLPGPSQREEQCRFVEPAAAVSWFAAEHTTVTAVIGYLVANGRPASAWKLCSAAHEYVQAGGRLANWPQLLVQVATATRTANDRYGELVVRNLLGIAYTGRGRIPDACAEFTTALGIAAATDDRDAEGIVLVNLAMAEAEFGAPGEALTHLSRALHLLQDPAATATARELLADLDVPATPTHSAAAS